MKVKIVSIIVLVLIVFQLLSYYNVVQAYSGELDPENYITFSSNIDFENGIGTGTIYLSSEASGYTISYQKVDMTIAQADEMITKYNAIKQYEEEEKANIENKKANVQTLKETYDKLVSSESATQTELIAAENEYKKAYEEYETYVNTVSSNHEKMLNEYYEIVPNYDSNAWITTTNSENNVTLDFKNINSERIDFVVWAKIENGTNTYYDFTGYSSIINKDTNSSGDTTGEWTDFSNAKFELVKSGTAGAALEISGINYKVGSFYYAYITSSSNKPDITSLNSDEKIILIYNDENNKMVDLNSEILVKKIELNQDLYATIVEKNSEGKENIVVYGKKLTRFEEPKYHDAFHATFMTNKTDQIVLNFTHSREHNRKIEIKVGKITDTDILNKLKNQDASGFSDLLKFAKSSQSIYHKTLDADKDGSASIEYNAGASAKTTDNAIINIDGIEDEEYYYLYIKTDDENGKYISNEAVTLAKGLIAGELKSLFFYGSADFKWSNFGTVPIADTVADDTTSPIQLPHTGSETLICIGVCVIIISAGIIFYIKSKKY